jgi:hypothetical protein
MDVRDIRRNNLLLLLAEYPEFGSISAFAQDVGAAPNHLSQILSEKIKITMGNTMARRIEEKKGLPHGWMDAPHDDSDPLSNLDDETRDYLETALLIYKASPIRARAIIKEFLREQIKKSGG